MSNYRHGHGADGAQSSTYVSWRGMIDRCTNPNVESFKSHGARGIRVCDRWRSFENFLADMGERPPGTSIDRRDNDRGYDPGNCQWATREEQDRHRQNSRVLTAGDRSGTIAEWSKWTGIPYHTIYSRLARGASHAQAVGRFDV